MKILFYREDRVALPIFIGEKWQKHILSCSFGKDSIATALLALQHGEPLDEDCEEARKYPASCPNTTDLSTKQQSHIFEQRGIPTRVLRPKRPIYPAFTMLSHEEKPRDAFGIPSAWGCTIQRDCKLPPIKAYQKALPRTRCVANRHRRR